MSPLSNMVVSKNVCEAARDNVGQTWRRHNDTSFQLLSAKTNALYRQTTILLMALLVKSVSDRHFNDKGLKVRDASFDECMQPTNDDRRICTRSD